MSKKALAIHAHPDDTEIYCIGTLALLRDAGYDVTIATMTAGQAGGHEKSSAQTAKVRKAEAKRAAASIKAKYVCLSGEDAFLFDTQKMRKEVTALVRREKADVVFTHLPIDYHADHRITYNIVEIGTLLATLPNVRCGAAPLEKTPLLYHTAPIWFKDIVGNPPPKPHFFVDVTLVMEQKIRALECHRSQYAVMKSMQGLNDFSQTVRDMAALAGKMARVKYAEAFWQHLGGGFSNEPVLQKDVGEYLRTGK